MTKAPAAGPGSTPGLSDKLRSHITHKNRIWERRSKELIAGTMHFSKYLNGQERQKAFLKTFACRNKSDLMQVMPDCIPPSREDR